MEMNGEDFSQDVQTTNDESMNGNDNHAAGGGGDKPANGGGDNNGSAEAPGRDDDRYVEHAYIYIGCRLLRKILAASRRPAPIGLLRVAGPSEVHFPRICGVYKRFVNEKRGDAKISSGRHFGKWALHHHCIVVRAE